MLLYLLLGIAPLLATFFIALFILRTRPGAAVAIQCAGLVTWALLVYVATSRRQKMKRDFNIVDSTPGSFMGDCMYWYFCCCFMLAQETRTLVQNQVEDGDWRGPAQEDVEAAAAPQDQIMIKQ
jgi:Cys-rich protein (TIGR01571 family)